MKRTAEERFAARLARMKRTPRRLSGWARYSQLAADRRIPRLQHIRGMIGNMDMNPALAIDLTDIIDALAAKEGGAG